ncbi:MAG: hypothetical protein COA88_06455 [Kordia sp.]|nr:MAG: hypothetical protein COA88_06455 [Kordia sp.]
MKKALLILITLCVATIGYSQTFTDSNFIEYTVIPSTTNVEITDYDYANGGATVNIPATVDYNSATYNVTEIGDEAFLAFGSTEKITSIVIPDGVTSIGSRAFQANLLASVTIPDSVTQLSNLSFGENPLLANVVLSNNLISIAQFSFISCSLINVAIPDNVTTIGLNAFRNNQLTSVTIPNNVASIAAGAFFGNPLTCVVSESTIPPTVGITVGGNTNLDSFGGSRSNIDLSIPTGTATAYATAQWTGFNSVAEGLSGTFVVGNITYQINANPNNEVTVTDYNTAGGTVVNIPATVTSGCTDFSVTEIGNSAFNNKGLTSISIPDSVTTIGDNAIRNNNNLTSVIIPDSVISIGNIAFVNNGMTNLVIGNNVATIGDYAFRFNSITSVTIPDSVTNIGQRAFESNAISNLVIGNGLIGIGDYVFGYNDITSVTIPDSVLTIGDNAFVSNDEMTNLVIGNSVTSIGEFAFAMNPSLAQLTSVTIPSSVTSIGDYAFSIATLTDVFSESTTPPIITTGTNDTFGSTSNRGTIHLHIPGGTAVMDAYVNDSGALWTGFNPVTQDALGVSDFELSNDITVITTTDAINITHSNSIRLENYTIYSITGAKVTTGKEINIDTRFLAGGIYILKLDFNKGTVTKKFVAN